MLSRVYLYMTVTALLSALKFISITVAACLLCFEERSKEQVEIDPCGSLMAALQLNSIHALQTTWAAEKKRARGKETTHWRGT